ncbi:outer membrane beta-barrel family protein, partial [Algibacter sp.]|nr:outer membrane beta-barrel family protein [Algibacter sp.]
SQKIKLYSTQLDYELPINNKGLFEVGFKTSNINSESILNQFNFENEVKEQDLENSDTFLYKETNYAMYSSYSKEWESWSMKLGLRTELTDIKGNSISTNSNNNNTYAKLFPSFHVLYNLNDGNEVYFNYNKRIYRPRYSQLNPFKFFINDNTFLTGDPNLRPQIDDLFVFGYTFNQYYTFEIYYRNENDPVFEIAQQDNDNNILKYINTNIDNGVSYGLDFTTYTQLSQRWNLYVLSSLFNYENAFFFENENDFISTKKWSIYAQIINYFSFLEDNSFTLDLSYNYLSPVVDGPAILSSRSGLDINLRKSFWDNKASLSMGIIDVFNTKNFNQRTRYSNQDNFFKSEIENRLFTFEFNYKFGNFKLNNNQKNIELNERDRLEKSN